MSGNSSKMMTKLNYTDMTKTLIKQAIRYKGVEVSDDDTLRSYANKIMSIPVGTDESDATVTPADMIIGKIAYNDNVRVVGTLPLYNSLNSQAITIIDDTVNSLINSSYSTTNRLVLNDNSNINISIPYNTLATTIGLNAGDIKRDVTILGVTGIYGGGTADVSYLYKTGEISIAEITPQLMQSVSNNNITVAEIATYPAIAINSCYDNYIIISLVNNTTLHCAYLFKIENDSLVYIDKLHNNDSSWTDGYYWQSIITDIDNENHKIYVVTARTDYTFVEDSILSTITYSNDTHTKVDSIINLPSQGGLTFGAMIYRPYGFVISERYLYKFNRENLMYDYLLYNRYLTNISNWDNQTGEVTVQGSNFYQYTYYGLGNDGYSYTWIQNNTIDYDSLIGDFVNGIITPYDKCIFANGVILQIENEEITTTKLAEFDMTNLVGFVPKYIYYLSDDYFIIAPATGTASLVKFDNTTNTFDLLYSGLTTEQLTYMSRYMLRDNCTDYALPSGINLKAYEKITLYLPIPDVTHRIGVLVEGNPIYYNSFNKDVQVSEMLIGKKAFDFNGEVLTGTMPDNGQLNYTPSTSAQQIPLGYTSGGTIQGVTSAIDSNIQAGNIKVGVDILGVTGTFTSDATATAGDIISGETAYVNGQLITGDLNDVGTLSAFEVIDTTPTSDGFILDICNSDMVDFYWKYDEYTTRELNLANTDITDAINLLPAQIKVGEVVLGITGTYEGTISQSEYTTAIGLANDILGN